MSQNGFAHLVLIIAIAVSGLTGLIYYSAKNGNIKFPTQNSPQNSNVENSETQQVSISPTPTTNVIKAPTSKAEPTIPQFEAVSVSGFAYEDRNNDGIYNSDDPPLPNMQFLFLDTYNSQQLTTVFSNTTGNFSITLNVRGNLIIRPTNYNNFVVKTADKIVSSSQNGLQFSFRSASAPASQNVGILEGNVFHDGNRNSIRDSGESSVNFYKLYLKSGGNYFYTVENAQTTDAGGHFKYVNLPVPGSYTLELSNPTGAFEILQPQTTFTLNSVNFQNTNIQIPVYKY